MFWPKTPQTRLVSIKKNIQQLCRIVFHLTVDIHVHLSSDMRLDIIDR